MRVDNPQHLSKRGNCDFTTFLAYLDPNSDRAAETYKNLRQAVIRYLQRHGSGAPEEQADETLEILCRKITQGEPIADVNSFARGVAANVLKRGMQKESRFESLDDTHTLGDDPPARNALENRISFAAWQKSKAEELEDMTRARLECMRMCLKQLPDEDRKLLLEYDPNQSHDRARREEMAERYGMTSNLLRVKVYRIKERLQRCRDECLKEKSK
jgi:DNA-directed RNA polymerase specialized sigma24 family protein